MKQDDEFAAILQQYEADLNEIAEYSRRLGARDDLVLHGGGNTSIKSKTVDITGEVVDVILVKGSGWDLKTIEPAGFAPLRRDRVQELLTVESMTDTQMVNEIKQASMLAAAPVASIEALLHGFLPDKVVLHSHADAIVGLTNQSLSDEEISEILGGGIVVLPYIMPGFDLAKAVSSLQLPENTQGIVLRNHGLFTFAEHGNIAFEKHMAMVDRAHRALGSPAWGDHKQVAHRQGSLTGLATLRRETSRVAGTPLLLEQNTSAVAADLASSENVAEVMSRGPATPEHVIRTKRDPMVGRDVDAYAQSYRDFFERGKTESGWTDVTQLDPAPRMIYDSEFGLVIAGQNTKELEINRDITLHTMDIVAAADRMTGYHSLDDTDSFIIEYWELEQAKLRGKVVPQLAGAVVVLAGISTETTSQALEKLLSLGAAVVVINCGKDAVNLEALAQAHHASTRVFANPELSTDVISQALETAVRDFGGIDYLVVDSDLPELGETATGQQADQQQTDEQQTLAAAQRTGQYAGFCALLTTRAAELLALSPVSAKVIELRGQHASDSALFAATVNFGSVVQAATVTESNGQVLAYHLVRSIPQMAAVFAESDQ